MLFIMYEYAACLLAALISGTFLFTASAMCVMLWRQAALRGGGGENWHHAPMADGKMDG